MRPIILCDTEYTTFDDPAWRGGFAANPYPAVPREIVQLGALKLHPETLAIIDSFELLVRPVINPVLSAYFLGLTSITQHDVDTHGVPFKDAWQRFGAFAGEAYDFASYGNDWAIIALNLQLNALPVPDVPCTNLRPWFHQQAPETIGVNSGRLAEVLGLRQTKDEHTALADCHSVREAAAYLIGQGAPHPIKQ